MIVFRVAGTVTSSNRSSVSHAFLIAGPAAAAPSLGATVRLAEVIGALTYALDLTEGQRPGHTLRTTLIAMRLAEQQGLDGEALGALYYAALLKDSGCSSNAARMAALGRSVEPEDRGGPRNCHDVTAYPAMGLLAASCSTHSILVDISNPEKPFRIDALADTNNYQGRHTAAFSNDGKKLIQTDEWGGGTGPMCQASSMIELGGNTVISLDAKKQQTQRAYFKLPSAQSAEENCVAHNGGIIPVPGRDLYVQGWYQGGVNIMDFTDPDKAFEIAYFDRGAIDPPKPVDVPSAASAAAANVRGGGNVIGGSWGAYYWNGLIFSSEMDRGLDILELTPSAQLSANEIAAAKLVVYNEFNPQSQPKYSWPPAFVVVRSYLDQLVRNGGLAADRTTAIAQALDVAEMKSGLARGSALSALALQVDKDAAGNITAVHAEYLPDTKSGTEGANKVKVKGAIHWLPVHASQAAEVRMYDRLFSDPQPDAGSKDYLELLTPNSKRVLNAFVEASLADAQPDDKFQFERMGYFVADRKDHTAARPVFNLAVTLKDSWGK